MNPNNQQPGVPPPNPQTQASQSYGTTPGSGVPQTPYDFIMATKAKPHKNILKPTSLRARLLLVIIAGSVLVAGIIITSSILKRGSEENTAALLSLTAEQQEIVRIAGIGLQSSIDPATTALAETTKLAVGSDLASLSSYLSKSNVLITAAALNAKKNPKTDSTLAIALSNSQFDDVFNTTLKSSLTVYAQDIKKSFPNATGPTIKSLMITSYRNASNLVQ